MAGKKDTQPVTVTVRPDGTYYVEKEKVAPRRTQIVPVVEAPTAKRPVPSPIAAAITTSLRDLAGIATAARAVAPALGKYGVVAAIGLGVLNAWADSRPRQANTLQRFQLRRIRRTR